MTPINEDAAALGGLAAALTQIGAALDAHADAPPYDTTPYARATWAPILDVDMPQDGLGSRRVLDLLADVVVPHGMPADQGGFCGWIFTAANDVPIAAQAVASRVGAQRYMHFSNGLLEAVSLRWLRELFGLTAFADALYSSGGTTANLLALAAARQSAYEAIGIDPAHDGLAGAPAGAVYGSVECHHCMIKAAGALGLGRTAVRMHDADARHRAQPHLIREAIHADRARGVLPIAVIANAGSTNTGSIDPIAELADLCAEEGVWLHVDGAYGLPGLLDERVADRFTGVAGADSVVTDLHKWLNVPTGIGVTMVKRPGLLERALAGEPSAYIEGQFADVPMASAWDSLGTPYHEMSLELSANSRGVVVWAALSEIGAKGFADRVRRHRDCAAVIHELATAHPRLESLVEPELSVACLRYVGEAGHDASRDLDRVNADILSRLRQDGLHTPSGTTVDGMTAIRPCYVSAWSTSEHARALVEAVVAIGDELSR